MSLLAFVLGLYAAAQPSPSFAVASIRPSAAEVKFEHDGAEEISPGSLIFRDVTLTTCIKWAYGVQDSQVSGPPWIKTERFDIRAKAESPADADQMKLMMRALLADRFGLTFHRQKKELRSYVMAVVKGGHKLRPSDPDTKPFRQNSATGTVARATTMGEFADFIAGPLQTPVVDSTGLTGRYDFTLDFTSYLPEGAQVMKPDFANTTGIILAAMQGELGLKLDSRKETIEVLVIDHVAMPSGN